MKSKKTNPKQLMQSKKLKIGKEYLITIKRTDPFIPTLLYVHKTKAKVVNWFNGGLRFWFDDAYGQECFSPIDGVISIEDL
jgi:hypothetical protein